MVTEARRPYQKPNRGYRMPPPPAAPPPLAEPTEVVLDAATETAANFSTVSGVIERITYQNDENGYTIAKLLPEKARAGELVTVVGNLPSMNAGEHLELEGWWESHRTYGRQFKVKNYRVKLPATITGLQKYLR